MIPKKLHEAAIAYFTLNSRCKLPMCVPSRGQSQSEPIEFDYVGTVGNRSMLQFKAVPGGWTVTLSPQQLLDMKEKELKGLYKALGCAVIPDSDFVDTKTRRYRYAGRSSEGTV